MAFGLISFFALLFFALLLSVLQPQALPADSGPGGQLFSANCAALPHGRPACGEMPRPHLEAGELLAGLTWLITALDS